MEILVLWRSKKEAGILLLSKSLPPRIFSSEQVRKASSVAVWCDGRFQGVAGPRFNFEALLSVSRLRGQ